MPEDVVHRAVFVHVAGDAEGRQVAHFLGRADRAAEHQERHPPAAFRLPDRAHQFDAAGVRHPQIHHYEIDRRLVVPQARQQLADAPDRDSSVPSAGEGRRETVSDKRGVVDD